MSFGAWQWGDSSAFFATQTSSGRHSVHGLRCLECASRVTNVVLRKVVVVDVVVVVEVVVDDGLLLVVVIVVVVNRVLNLPLLLVLLILGAVTNTGLSTSLLFTSNDIDGTWFDNVVEDTRNVVGETGSSKSSVSSLSLTKLVVFLPERKYCWIT